MKHPSAGKRPAVTFVIPGDFRSGGIRVTAVMGNLLLERGYRVRVVHPHHPILVKGALGYLRERLRRVVTRRREAGWLHLFRGEILPYRQLADLSYLPGEVVFAVGTYMIRSVFELNVPGIFKIRYNHGFPAQMTDEYRAAWSLRMPTVTVSRTLVPELERMTGEPVLAVLPNGVDTREYFVMPEVARVGIGTIFSEHPNKAPEDIIQLMNRVGEVFPDHPRLVFSMDARPNSLSGCSYERYPSIDRVREIYNSALIWLLASRTEGLPGPVLEAMACGAAVISTDNAGSLELIRDGENGLIVPRGDIEAFLQRIGQVLGDGSLRSRLVQGGFETVRRYSWMAAAERMDAFLREVQMRSVDTTAERATSLQLAS